MLLQTRKLILGAFFQVETASRLSEAESQIADQAFDMVVLCYTLSDDEYGQITAMIQDRQSQPRTLTLTSNGNSHRRLAADGAFLAEDGPYSLLKKSAEILGVDLRGRGRVVAS